MKSDKINIFLKTFYLVNVMFTKSVYNDIQERGCRLCMLS